MTLTTLLRATLTIAAAFVLAGCTRPGPMAGRGGMPPMPVEVASATVSTVTDRFEAVGTVEAMEAITVVSEIDAAITKLPFEEGGIIHKGDLIAQLDDAQLAAELSRAEALEAQTRASFSRVKSVVDQNAGSLQDLDDAAAALKVAESNLALARARFNKTRITAPFDGIIGARKVSVGTFVRAGQAITELANIDAIRVNFSAPERFLGHLNRGAAVTLTTPAFPGQEARGTIIAIEPMIDAGTRSARIVAQISNPGRKLRPGLSANITAVLGTRANAVIIPSEAVFANGDQTFVFAVKPDSTALRVPISLGTRMPDAVEVVHGLSAGATVVRAGHQKLFDGARIMPVAAATGSSAQ